VSGLFLFALQALGQVHEVRAGDALTAARVVSLRTGVTPTRVTERDGRLTLRDEVGHELLVMQVLRAQPLPAWTLIDDAEIPLTWESREQAESVSAQLLVALHGGEARFHREGEATVFSAPVPARLLLVTP